MSNPQLNTREAPAGGQSNPAGSERKVDTKGAGIGPAGAASAKGGSVVGDTSLRGGTKELTRQHPHGYMAAVGNKETSDHVRHMPLHGLRPSK